jgi:hypothetical protein
VSLAVLGAEIEYLRPDAGKRFEELEHARQVQLLAYYFVDARHAHQVPAVTASAAPAAQAREGVSAAARVAVRGGGRLTAGQESIARAVAAPMILRDWAKRTGRDPRALALAMAKKG